jgi:hypothetical protein
MPIISGLAVGIAFVALFALLGQGFTSHGFLSNRDILIDTANETMEAKYFLSKYPDAQIDVIRDGANAGVTYTVARQVGDPAEPILRKRILAIVFKPSNSIVEPSEFRLYCIPGLSTPAIGGYILGRIDNEGCFGNSLAN